VAVRIRMKKMGKRHRPFYRICAMDARTPRDGRVLEELGTYDPMVSDTDARAVLNAERVDYWLGVGAQPSEKVKVLIKKYGSKGTRAAEQRAALDRLAQERKGPEPPPRPMRPHAADAPDEDSAEESSAEPPGE
jgi:small subunit ribosomal protein S16